MRPGYFYGYSIVGASFVIQAVSIGAMFTYGVFFKEFQADFGWSRATISVASSLAFFVMGAVGILAGRLSDRIGPKAIMVVSGISLGLGFMLMSRLQTPWQLYLLYGVLAGIGLSTHDVITLSTVARWFIKRRGMMTGIVKVGTGTGQVLVPPFAVAIIAAFGWRNAYLILGTLTLLVLVAAAQVLRRDPQSIGLLADGGSHAPGEAGNGPGGGDMPLSAAVRKPQFWIICIAELVAFSCIFTIIVHIVPHATDLGLSLATAVAVQSTFGGVSMLGRFVMGVAIDRIGGKRSLIICFSIFFCGFIWLQMAREAWMLFLFAVIYGLAHGSFFTAVSPTLAEFFGTGSHGLLFGIVLFSGTIGGAIGPLLAGHTFDMTGSYQMVFLLLSGLAGIGFVLMTLLRPMEGTES
ncbi:MAG: MFS transporter [Desulfobacteraceae bacterium]